MKDLTLSGDVGVTTPKAKADLPRYAGAPVGVGLEEAIGTGAIGIGYAGNAYVIRNTKSPTVFVVSPAGQVVRRMVLKPPVTGLWRTASSLSGARAAVDFGTLSNAQTGTLGQSKVYALYDLMTGKLLESYRPSPELGFAFACYTQNAFIFIGAKPDGSLTLIQAQPR